MLKMLVWEFSLFGRDDTKQAKSLIFIVVPQVEQVPKNKKLKEMLDVTKVIRTYNNSNYKLT